MCFISVSKEKQGTPDDLNDSSQRKKKELHSLIKVMRTANIQIIQRIHPIAYDPTD
jgi:hypothetical protein